MRLRLESWSLIAAATLIASGASAEPKLVLKASMKSVSVPMGQADDQLVNIDFPEPTEIKDIARAISLWTGKTLIVDRNVKGKVEIHAPERVTLEEAQTRFVAALNELGLVLSEHQGITQILPARAITPEREAIREARSVPQLGRAEEVVSVDYAEPTDIRDVIRDVSKWSGKSFTMDRNVVGKVQIWAAKPVAKDQAYRIYLAALDQLGYTPKPTEKGDVQHVEPLMPLVAHD